jgi:peptidyl-prolyl cis-trans isomerase-like 2
MAPSVVAPACGADTLVAPGTKSSGACAASFTSTDMDIVTRFVPQVETEGDRQRARYDKVKALGKKGYVQLVTSLGNINLEVRSPLNDMSGSEG